MHLSGRQLEQGLDLKTFVWTRGCWYLHFSEKPYNTAGELFEDIHVDDDICTLLQQRWGRVLLLGYWGMVVLCGLHYLLEYGGIIEADTSLEFHGGQAFTY